METNTVELLFAHERSGDKPKNCSEMLSDAHLRSHLKNQSVDCSRIPSASSTLKDKYAGVAEESLRSSMKERVEENETVGTPAREGLGGGQ